MSKHLIKIDNPRHVALSVAHAGKDNQYCEAGEVVAIDWQPSAGWGLQEAHYVDEDNNIVAIDLSLREFTMPAKAVTISGTAKRFVIQDWTEGIGKNTKGTAFNRPTLGSDDAGFEYYDETLKKKILWNGTNWVNIDGTGLYLTFIAKEDGCHVGFWQNEENESQDFPSLSISLKYSTDYGVTWNNYTVSDETDPEDINPNLIDLDKGQIVMFRGANTQVSNFDAEESDEGCFLCAYIDGDVAVTGDITSLLNGVGGDMALTHRGEFYGLFLNCTGLVQAPALPATTLAASCYGSMFSGCTGLVQAPALPSTTLAASCYGSMFSGCTGLVQAPALPATTLAEGCYGSMFHGCTGLVQAPALPATTLAANCYGSMFSGCTNIISHHVTTMNNSANVFQNNSACESFVIDDDTPPTIGSNTITGLKADCAVYVPAASVDAYKAKQYWSARAAYIQAKP